MDGEDDYSLLPKKQKINRSITITHELMLYGGGTAIGILVLILIFVIIITTK